jgi:sulfate adenylyltransferase subunit 1
VKEVIVAVNKMDLVDYSEEVYNKIKADFEALNAKSTFKEQNVSYIPLSALTGDNVVDKTDAMPWYKGQTILEHLEALEPADVYERGQRFPCKL